MSNFRTVCRPHTVFSPFVCLGRNQARSRIRISFQNSISWNPSSSGFGSSRYSKKTYLCFRLNQRRTIVGAANWTDSKSPYETLELERDADEDQIKTAFRRLAKFYHPDVYDGKAALEKGETAEARFIKIQAAYELLVNVETRKQYDVDNRVNPMKASQAWNEWVMKKRKAWDQRGEMPIDAWAEQRQRERILRARSLSRVKGDPYEEKKILAKEKKASEEFFNTTMRRHMLVLKKRDLMRKKAEEDSRTMLTRLLEAEGLELVDSDDDDEAA